MSAPTNDDRAIRATAAVNAYAEAHEDSDQLSDAERLTDLLTDLRHYCKEHRLPFESAVFMSEVHFTEEVATARAG